MMCTHNTWEVYKKVIIPCCVAVDDAQIQMLVEKGKILPQMGGFLKNVFDHNGSAVFAVN